MTWSRMVTLGETMALVRSVHVGPLTNESDLRLSIGGAESNVAIGLRRLGIAAAWIGRVGDDTLGRRVVRELQAEGVDVIASVDAEAATGLMLKEQRTSRDASVMYYRTASAGSRLSPDDLAAVKVTDDDLLHVSGITPALSSSASDAVDAAIALARKHDAPVSFDVNHRSSLWGRRDASPAYRRLASRSSIVFAGVDEGRMLAPGASKPADVMRAIAGLGPSQVVLKLGAGGCMALVDGIEYRQPAIAIDPLDTVGAGDAFAAGYLAELAVGADPAERLLTAVRTGAFACLNRGDWEGYPRHAELNLLESDEPVTR
jgi:2-dehydro-3-deoxygluconokinase